MALRWVDVCAIAVDVEYHAMFTVPRIVASGPWQDRSERRKQVTQVPGQKGRVANILPVAQCGDREADAWWFNRQLQLN